MECEQVKIEIIDHKLIMIRQTNLDGGEENQIVLTVAQIPSFAKWLRLAAAEAVKGV